MFQIFKSLLGFNAGGSSLSLIAIGKTTGPSLPYYFSAITYVYFATFFMYLIWALMLYLEESVLNETTTDWSTDNSESNSEIL